MRADWFSNLTVCSSVKVMVTTAALVVVFLYLQVRSFWFRCMIVAIVVIILVLFRIMMCTHLPLGCAAPYEAGVLYHPPLFIFSTDAQELFVHALYCFLFRSARLSSGQVLSVRQSSSLGYSCEDELTWSVHPSVAGCGGCSVLEWSVFPYSKTS